MEDSESRRRPCGEIGSVLLEALIALTILAVALLMMGPLLAMEVDLGARAEAHREGLAYLEAVIEAERAGVVALESGEVDPADLPLTPPALAGLALIAEVEPDPSAEALRWLRLEATYRVRGTPRSQHVTTLVWRPDG